MEPWKNSNVKELKVIDEGNVVGAGDVNAATETFSPITDGVDSCKEDVNAATETFSPITDGVDSCKEEVQVIGEDFYPCSEVMNIDKKRPREDSDEEEGIAKVGIGGGPKKSQKGKNASGRPGKDHVEEEKKTEKVFFPWSVTDRDAREEHERNKPPTEWDDNVSDEEEKKEKPDKSFNKWRDEKLVGEVLEQQQRDNSCWAIAVGHCIQGFLNCNVTVERDMKYVSIPYLINVMNTKKDGSITNIERVFREILRDGLMSDDDYKSRGSSKCKSLKINSFEMWPREGDKYVKEEDLFGILKKTPVVAVIELTEDFYETCGKGGIYKGPASVGESSQRMVHVENKYSKDDYVVTKHAVLIVGWGTSEDGVPYWIVKNSWLFSQYAIDI